MKLLWHQKGLQGFQFPRQVGLVAKVLNNFQASERWPFASFSVWFV